MKLIGQYKYDRITDRTVWPLFAALFISVFMLTVLTPKYADDFAYSFSFATDQRIRSVADIFPSMAVHRVLLNGRVVPHFLVQLFLMMPKAIFSLLNAMQTVLLLRLSSRCLQTEGKTKCLVLLCGVFSVWLFTPAFGENYLWLDGAVNYSWALTVLMLFLAPYISAWFGMPNENNTLLSVTHVVFSFAAGSWSENGSLAFLFLAGCLFLGIWKRERKLPVWLMLGICSAAAGYIFLMTAPATGGRAAALNLSVLIGNLKFFLKGVFSHLLILYLSYAALLVMTLVGKGQRDRIIFSILLFLAGFGALASFVFAAYFVERHFSCTVFLTVLSCIVLLDELAKKEQRLLYALTGVLTVVFLFRFTFGVVDIVVASRKEAEREQIIRDAVSKGENTVTLTNYFPSTVYAVPFILDAPDDWVNMTVASYYGLDTVYGRNPDESE